MVFFIYLSYTGSLNWQVITFVRVQKCCHFLNIENMKTGYKLLNSLIIWHLRLLNFLPFDVTSVMKQQSCVCVCTYA